jgi:hypothetical protein
VDAIEALLAQADLGLEALFLPVMGPVFLAFIGWQAWCWRGKRAAYSLRDTLNNAALALSHQTADGNAVEETVLELDPLRRHGYRVTGFAAPFGWWVSSAQADWLWTPHPAAVQLRWRYRFDTRGRLSRLIVGIIARGFFLPDMRRCVAALAAGVEAAPPTAPAPAPGMRGKTPSPRS